MGLPCCPVCLVRYPTCKKLKCHLMRAHLKSTVIKVLLKNFCSIRLSGLLIPKPRKKTGSATATSVNVTCKESESTGYVQVLMDETETSSELLKVAGDINESVLCDDGKKEETMGKKKKGKTVVIKNKQKTNTDKIPKSNFCARNTDIDEWRQFNVLHNPYYKRKLMFNQILKEDRLKNAKGKPTANKTVQTLKSQCFCAASLKLKPMTSLKPTRKSTLLKSTVCAICFHNGNNNSLYSFFNFKYYCNTCGNGYKSKEKLLLHLGAHKIETIICNNCDKNLTMQDPYLDQKPTILKIFACYKCKSEFISSSSLCEHLNYHDEQETFETILDMEEQYFVPKIVYDHFSQVSTSYQLNCDYKTKISNIKNYLIPNEYEYKYSLPATLYNDHTYSKIVCDICYAEIFLCDYESHLQYYHLIEQLYL